MRTARREPGCEEGGRRRTLLLLGILRASGGGSRRRCLVFFLPVLLLFLADDGFSDAHLRQAERARAVFLLFCFLEALNPLLAGQHVAGADEPPAALEGAVDRHG